MGEFAEPARAKINLTLKVLGKRPDGYHELDSLVAFADAGDVVTLDTDAPAGVDVTGPFGPSIAGENLLQVCLHRLAKAAPRLRLGRITLNKRLPVAAGIGGGSADAGAALRAVRRANPELDRTIDWLELATPLGADVPVCFCNVAQWMSGIGERLEPLGVPLPKLNAVLVNPLIAVPPDKTARVFRALAAGPLTDNAAHRAHPEIPDRDALLALMKRCGNGLAMPAKAVVPEIKTVMAVLSQQSGVELVQMSGGGPTCFGVFASREDANAAAAGLRRDHPAWWVEATTLG